MKRYIWILLVFALITDLAFAQMESLRYEQDFVLLPVKDREYINILVEADIVVKDVSPDDVYEFLDLHQPNKYGVGKYKLFTHIDVRPNKARWKG